MSTILNSLPHDFADRVFEINGTYRSGRAYGQSFAEDFSEKTVRALAKLEVGQTYTVVNESSTTHYTRLADDVGASEEA